MFLFLVIPVLLLLETATAEPLPFPPTYQRIVNDTTASILDAYQRADRDGLRSIINREPLIARKALINLLRQPDKLEAARTPGGTLSARAVSRSWKSLCLISSWVLLPTSGRNCSIRLRR